MPDIYLRPVVANNDVFLCDPTVPCKPPVPPVVQGSGGGYDDGTGFKPWYVKPECKSNRQRDVEAVVVWLLTEDEW